MKTHIKLFYYMVTISVLLISCKTKKGIITINNTNKMSVAKIAEKVNAQKSDFKTLRTNIKTNVKTLKNEQNFTIGLRILKNKKIWMSFKKVGVSGMKFLITPNKVQFYNKLNKTYFKGNFKILSKLMGTPINFQQLQAILIGNSVFDFTPSLHNVAVLKEEYLMYPKQQEKLFEQFVTIYPATFKIKKQKVIQPQKQSKFVVNYQEYQKINEQLIPLKIYITTLKKTTETQINMEYKSTTLNSELKFPFNIPSGYEKITFD